MSAYDWRLDNQKDIDELQYHWSLYGLGLDDAILEKVYRKNAPNILYKK